MLSARRGAGVARRLVRGRSSLLTRPSTPHSNLDTLWRSLASSSLHLPPSLSTALKDEEDSCYESRLNLGPRLSLSVHSDLVGHPEQHAMGGSQGCMPTSSGLDPLHWNGRLSRDRAESSYRSHADVSEMSFVLAYSSLAASDPARFVRRWTPNGVALAKAQARTASHGTPRAVGLLGVLHQSSPQSLQHSVFFSTDTSQRRATQFGTTKVPTPKSAPPPDPSTLETLRQSTPKSILQKGLDLTVRMFKAVFGFLLRLPGNLWFYISKPDEIGKTWNYIKEVTKEEVNHYWVGFKLLWADIKTAQLLVGRTLRGSTLTRRERKQLLRTVSDLFRIVPFSIMLIIPLMEFAIPFVLRLFPGILPSTFQDSLKAEENMKRELQSRIAMAQFFQETMEQLAKEQKRKAGARKKELAEAGVNIEEEAGDSIDKREDSAASMLKFLENARNGEMIPPDVIVRYANYFQDDLTLDNMPRMQLVNMCKYMSISPYGSDAFLRFQLRHRIRVLKEDDQRILWEGIDSLTKMELREACQERGMRSTGLSKDAYKRSLQQWLDLSVNKNVPISLLIMSRTFFLRDEIVEPKEDETKSIAGLADAISGLDKEVVDQVILEVATSEEKNSDPDIRKLQLEVVSKQNELIRQEQAERDAASKRKEEKEPELTTESPSGEADEKESVASVTPTDSPSTDFDETPTEPSDSKETDQEEDRVLSAAEMDAISQLVSDDPVSKERAELERIKAAMGVKEETLTDAEWPNEVSEESVTAPEQQDVEPRSGDDAGSVGAGASGAIVGSVDGEAEDTTRFSIGDANPDLQEGEAVEDAVVARLKQRIESMVDKIEVQLSQAEVKIGDKLHFLDKDRDGVLSRDEMAQVLKQVLKRKISDEEAMEIASEMDDNRDGFFTVDELITWLDEHRLVKLVEEGRDADMDRIMESQSTEQPKTEEAQSKESDGS